MSSDLVRLVTVSAAYGAGGSVVAPALARRLAAPSRPGATTGAGGVGAGGPCAEPLTTDEASLTPARWLLACLSSAMPAGPTPSPLPPQHQDESLRPHCQADT